MFVVTIEATAKKITPAARKWSYNNYGTKGKKRCQTGVQALKNKFVDLTQFAHDPLQQKLLWKTDIQLAADDAINKTCPHWESDKKDRVIYNTIQKTKEKALWYNRRRDWLFEKARAWLQVLAGEVQSPEINPDNQINYAGEEFHPRQAIDIAYYIFLRGTGKIESFVRDLERKVDKNIHKFINAYKGHLLGELQVLLLSNVSNIPLTVQVLSFWLT